MDEPIDPRTEQERREADGWAEFEGLLSQVSEERLTAPGVLEGWTVKEMLHHVTGWLEECVARLEAVRAGTYVDIEETDEMVDARNAAFAEAARGLDVATVRERLETARARVLELWRELPEIDEAAIDWFGGETYEHYEEHVPDLERAAD
jgi:hypothetical protein